MSSGHTTPRRIRWQPKRWRAKSPKLCSAKQGKLNLRRSTISEVLYVDEQALAETNLPAQRMQPIPQNEIHAESQTVEEPQVTAVTRNQSRRVRFGKATKHRPTSQEAVIEVDDLPAHQESPISPQGGAQRSAREGAHEERRWADLKAYLKGDVESLSFKRAANASKLADRFVLDEDGLHQYVGKGRKLDEVGEHEPQLRLVISTTMIDEELQSCHDAIEGGHQGITRTFHRVKKDYYWVGMLFQCSFTGYVIAKAMSSTKAQDVAEVFEEYQFRRFGAPTMIRHDRDPRFMSETFKAFAELIQARSRATLSYRPQANGQQERSVKSIVQTVNVYVEDPLQQDWDDIAEKMAHAINNSMDTTRKETPFYLVHGWDCGVAERTNIVRCGYPPKPQQPPSRVGTCLACAEGGPLAVRPFRDSGCLALADTG
ncbi:unnamed protein product [Phytophthora fragariaefolia]|uniref:Unnamed protein product n=1 Tax=Phytophthora fragariaefolia TaxID=1490495 RepID=A0A9W6YEI6_9STRA|nr:unnamed protein product [Phytophthora fragariaefolia]